MGSDGKGWEGMERDGKGWDVKTKNFGKMVEIFSDRKCMNPDFPWLKLSVCNINAERKEKVAEPWTWFKLERWKRKQ